MGLLFSGQLAVNFKEKLSETDFDARLAEREMVKWNSLAFVSRDHAISIPVFYYSVSVA